MIAWAAAERHTGQPGIFGLGHRPRPGADEASVTDLRMLLRAGLAAVAAIILVQWELAGRLWGWLTGWVINPLTDRGSDAWVLLNNLNGNLLFPVVLLLLAGRAGGWPGLYRAVRTRRRQHLAREESRRREAVRAATPQPLFPQLGAAGFGDLAARFEAEARAGRLNDVDYARIRRAWEWAEADPDRVALFRAEGEANGAAAFGRTSGARDVPVRVARHDLKTRQVRLGTILDDERTPAAYRRAGFALDPAVLGTSLLAVGPGGAGERVRLLRPIAESLCLQALSGTASVLAVGGARSDFGPRESFDIVIAPGDPASPDRLDLFGSGSPDTAAEHLATALLPAADAEQLGERAQLALRHLLVPFNAAYRRHPSIRELRELLDGTPESFKDLLERLRAAGLAEEHERELHARVRQQNRPGDPGGLLADRLALLDRPALAAGLGGGSGPVSGSGVGEFEPFAMADIERPLRVRVELPEDGHPEAARILLRLVVGQFVRAAAAREDRSLFAALLVDDAADAVDEHVVRGLQRLRGAHAGAVLALRTLADVPEPLRAPLVGAVGCRIALPGLPPWDGRLFSDAWGTSWRDEESVTRTPDRTGGILRRGARGLRGALTGKPVQTESVTTRKVERELWSPNDLSQSLHDGQAVASLTTTTGTQTPPLLIAFD